MATAILVHELQKRLPKVIKPELHGVLDYAHAALFLTAGVFLWKRNRAASLAALALGSVSVMEALITDYPMGRDTALSFESHGKLDAALASASLIAPQLLGFSDTPEATLFRVNAVVSAAIVGLTDYSGTPSGASSLVAG